MMCQPPSFTDPRARPPRSRHWVLEFEPSRPQNLEPLMGWTTSQDPYRPIRE
nr:hypothetical protein [Psychrobacter sp.]